MLGSNPINIALQSTVTGIKPYFDRRLSANLMVQWLCVGTVKHKASGRGSPRLASKLGRRLRAFMARDPLCSSPVPTITYFDHGAGRQVLGLGAPPCIA